MEVFQFDGEFTYNDEVIKYKITDNSSPIIKINDVEKINRFIHFYGSDGQEKCFKAIYGDYDYLSNITDFDAYEWYKGMVEK